MKKVTIYARVSTGLQEREKTIESQLAELREICKKQGVQIVKEYIDDGWSGGTLDRPGLDQLRTEASREIFERVYFYDNDRLARKSIYQGIVVEELEKKEIEVFFHDKPVADTPEGKFLFQILGAVAEYEKEKILERTRRGRIYKAKQKGIVGYKPPSGYNYIKKSTGSEEHFVVNEKEAKIVNLIFDLYLEFRSITRVVKGLALQKIKTREGNERWSRSTISTILKREDYIGTGYYRKRRSVATENGKKYRRRVKNSARLRDKSEWIPLKFPTIIDEGKFKAVQKILPQKSKPFGKSKHFYLLSGLIRCANCGSTLTGCESGGNLYYRCTNRRKRAPLPQDCHVKHMRINDFNKAVWTTISEAIMSPKILIAHISHLANEISESKSILKERKEKLANEEKHLAQKKDRLLEIYAEGSIGKEQFLKKMEVYNQEERKIQEEMGAIELKLTQVINKPVILESIHHFCDLAKQKLQTLTQEQKQQFLQYLIKTIILDSDSRKAKVIGRVPTEVTDLSEIVFPQIGAVSMSSKACGSPLRKGKSPSSEPNTS